MADSQKLTNIIKAYGNQDPELSYCQGYNYIVSLLLLYVQDEEMTFWCLFVIMNNMNWRKMFIANDPTSINIQTLIPHLLQQQAPRLYARMTAIDMMETISLNFTIP